MMSAAPERSVEDSCSSLRRHRRRAHSLSLRGVEASVGYECSPVVTGAAAVKTYDNSQSTRSPPRQDRGEPLVVGIRRDLLDIFEDRYAALKCRLSTAYVLR